MGHFKEAEIYFRRAVDVEPEFADAHSGLGYALQALGRFGQAEASIRRAIQYNPEDIGVQCSLGRALLLLGRSREAEACFLRVLEATPSQLDAVLGLGDIARFEGRFEEAEALYRQAFDSNPRLSGVWASLALLRKMSTTDGAWLKKAEEIAASGIATTEEVGLRFSIGKYWDDVGDFDHAFQSYQHANELLKTTARKYNRNARTAFVDDMVRVYSKETMHKARTGASASKRPIFVVGMPRSGTSLVEQIIASHPRVKGAGELGFWTEVLLEHVALIRQSLLPEQIRKNAAEAYLGLLAELSDDSLHVVDKAPVNSEYLGIIHSVFPSARVIYTGRDAIDTCLSCYFQYLSPALSYTMDLSDLVHYYREHHRLMAHWRTVLAPGTLLDVPYEGLVADQEGWTRKILHFLDLDWDARCLEFHRTARQVTTSSSWQVRQKIYSSSVRRWRNYEKFVGPLLELRQLDVQAAS
jgi:tetratricopeptide (TPR) repeat protein